jgi:hypothetical protein
VHPSASRIIVFLNNGGQVDVAGLHVAAVLSNGNIET